MPARIKRLFENRYGIEKGSRIFYAWLTKYRQDKDKHEKVYKDK